MVVAEHYAAIEAHAKREEVRGMYTLSVSSRCHLQTDIPLVCAYTLTYIPLAVTLSPSPGDETQR